MPSELRLANLKVRLLSLTYEALILSALLLVATAGFTAVVGDSQSQPTRTILQIYLLFVAGSYFVWSWTGGRRTLPMRTWRMRLVDHSGYAPSLQSAVIRYLIALVGFPLCAISILWVLVDPEGLFLHDRIARTRLITESAASTRHL
jgi:uncharacterized RDD family membrane protein YckC